MGITITTVEQAERVSQTSRDELPAVLSEANAAGLRMHVHNGFAWFLDDMVQALAIGLPELLFTQGVAADPHNPGDLDPEGCVRLAAAIDCRDKNWLKAAMCAGHLGSQGKDLDDAVVFVRDLSHLLRAAAAQRGMRVQ